MALIDHDELHGERHAAAAGRGLPVARVAALRSANGRPWLVVLSQEFSRFLQVNRAALRFPTACCGVVHSGVRDMSISTLGAVHVAVSLTGIVSGVVALVGMACRTRLPRWIALFLATTVFTSASGLAIPSTSFGPADVLAVISLPLLTLALFAIYMRGLVGLWKPAYLASSVAALYLNVFAGVVAAFQFLPTLRQVTPSLAHPPLRVEQRAAAFAVPSFAITQVVLILTFIALGMMAATR